MAMAQVQLDNRIWGALALRGVVAILFGLLALSRPDIAVTALVYLFGTYALFDGIFALVASVNVAELHGRWWPMLLAGVVGVVVGILTFINPATTAMGLIYYIALWAVLVGCLEVIAAIRLRKVVDGEWMLAVAGVLSIAAGVMIASRPNAGQLSVILVIGAFAIIYGVLLLALAFRLRGWHEPLVTT
jgi:uncharacterized membrane protein HdeD (DUF308 family)